MGKIRIVLIEGLDPEQLLALKAGGFFGGALVELPSGVSGTEVFASTGAARGILSAPSTAAGAPPPPVQAPLVAVTEPGGQRALVEDPAPDDPPDSPEKRLLAAVVSQKTFRGMVLAVTDTGVPFETDAVAAVLARFQDASSLLRTIGKERLRERVASVLAAMGSVA